MTKEKMMLLFSLLVAQIKNIGILSIDELKLKYEIACILINMVYDTNTYNDLFNEKSDETTSFSYKKSSRKVLFPSSHTTFNLH